VTHLYKMVLQVRSRLVHPRVASHYAPKTEVICAGVDLALPSRSDDASRAIVVRTQIRDSAMHLLLLIRISRIKGRDG